MANGAVATLFDVTCAASTYPDLLKLLPGLMLQFSRTLAEEELLMPQRGSPFAVSGIHFFTEDRDPFFNLDTDSMRLGQIQGVVSASVPAPEDAAKGQVGEPAVNWLRLLATDGAATGNLREVFRVGTAGGSPPESCEGMPGSFEIQYAAQ
jgi:hypothetical protein